MEHLSDNIIRGVVSNFFVLLHMFLAAETKYSKKATTIIFFALYALITGITIYLYCYYDITAISKISVIIWIVCGIVCKFLFTDNSMKWMFNIITVINVFIFVVIISYTLSATIADITLVRLVLYPVILFGFKKYLWPIYRQVVDRWQLFLAASLAVLLNFMYAIITASDIQVMLTEDIISLLLMVFTMLCIYATIFWSLSRTIKEYEYRSEKQQLELNENLLYAQLNAYEEFVESSKRNRHDLRHHNQIIIEYLQNGDTAGAAEYLRQYDSSINESTARQYCENHIANTVLCLYDGKTEAERIYFTVQANIPKSLAITLPELGSMLSNILENALEACKNADCEERLIAVTADIEDETLKIEIRNTVSGEVKFKNDLPVSTKEYGGTGTKSIVQIVSKYGGMINFKQNRDVFLTQIILPI